jgi:hypothetical protein
VQNTFQFILGIIAVIFTGCSGQPKPPPPATPCTHVELWHHGITTHGFVGSQYDSVIIEVYAKNSGFKELIRHYKVDHPHDRDNERKGRSIEWPRELTSANDYVLIFGDSLNYYVDSIQTNWVARYGHSFIGYDCAVTSYNVNGTIQSDGILLKEPSFKYPWE